MTFYKMAYNPARYEYPMLRSLHFLQHVKHRRIVSNLFLLEESPKNIQITKKKTTPIHSRKLSEGNNFSPIRKKRHLYSSNRIYIREAQNRPIQKIENCNDSVGYCLRTFALAVNKDKNATRRPINSSISEKKPYKNSVSTQGKMKQKEISNYNLTPW
ncbi:hypothetical protein SteCoe_28933 [Stentor coeruleus]|uniref:Uncharacterized protein n=1 Tax=Stentor coeruleus TaxID=5963 RepID=A0A1R2B759_9CILI|nr:hypothetical protein SteCoe_28933 [Stentor coeruleus]